MLQPRRGLLLLLLSAHPARSLNTLPLGSRYEASNVIKKSTFIGIVHGCSSYAEAQDFLKSVKEEHSKARHWCHGFVGGSNPMTERSSDDGEPQGTAGAPILAALRGEDLTDTVCVVVRYSGGIKLGAGGLIRAYGGAARDALAEAEKVEQVPKTTVVCAVPSSNVGDVYSLCSSYEDAVVLSEEFGGHEVRVCRTVTLQPYN